jgi:hypothetical protein
VMKAARAARKGRRRPSASSEPRSLTDIHYDGSIMPLHPSSALPASLSDTQTARAIQILTTEHFTLQGARANTVSETNGRIGIFLSTVSSTLIALAFVGQMSNLGMAFQGFALILLPTLVFLGAATFGRVLQSSMEDYFYLGGINRIHHFYAQVVPEISTYFVLSQYDDRRGRLRSMAISPSRWQILLTGGAVVGGINSILAGTLGGLLADWLLNWAILASTVAGASVFCVGVTLHARWASAEWARFGKSARPLFPTPH